MAFQPIPVFRRSVRKQIAYVLKHPLGMVKKLWKEEGCTATQAPTMEAYTEAANTCIASATDFIEHARLFAEAKRAYELWQKESEVIQVRKEIEALKLVIPLLVETTDCQIEHVFGGSDVSIPSGNPVVAQCAECGAAI